MTLNSGAALLMREGARHLEIENDHTLDEIEEMGLSLLYAYDALRGLREEEVLTLEGEVLAQPSLDSIRKPYPEIHKAQNMKYFYEDFLYDIYSSLCIFPFIPISCTE